MARESVDVKAARYLREGRLLVSFVNAAVVRATCRGGGAVYALGFDVGIGWWCDCPAVGRCCHLIALMSVTARPAMTRVA